jgi:AcrR family transcriptional regulator
MLIGTWQDFQERNRQRLMAALVATAEKGELDGVTILDLARSARISAGAIYRYFRNKEDLIAQAELMSMEEIQMTALSAILRCHGTREKHRALWKLAFEGPPSMILAYLKARAGSPQLREFLVDVVREVFPEASGELITQLASFLRGLLLEVGGAGERRPWTFADIEHCSWAAVSALLNVRGPGSGLEGAQTAQRANPSKI